MHRRFYGKPLPAKRDIKAALNFYSQTNEGLKMETKNIELTGKEINLLQVLLYSEFKIKSDRILHAASHGSNFIDGSATTITNILDKLNGTG